MPTQAQTAEVEDTPPVTSRTSLIQRLYVPPESQAIDSAAQAPHVLELSLGLFIALFASLLLFSHSGTILLQFPNRSIGAGVMEALGPSGLFGYAGAMYALLTAFIVWRMTARRGVPADRQIFIDVPTTTPMAAKLAHAEPPDAPAERAQPPK